MTTQTQGTVTVEILVAYSDASPAWLTGPRLVTPLGQSARGDRIRVTTTEDDWGALSDALLDDDNVLDVLDWVDHDCHD